MVFPAWWLHQFIVFFSVAQCVLISYYPCGSSAWDWHLGILHSLAFTYLCFFSVPILSRVSPVLIDSAFFTSLHIFWLADLVSFGPQCPDFVLFPFHFNPSQYHLELARGWFLTEGHWWMVPNMMTMRWVPVLSSMMWAHLRTWTLWLHILPCLKYTCLICRL